MFANYLIGLREGLEASLIVGILVAYVVKAGQSSRLGAIWAGTGIAIALSLGFGALLTVTSSSMSDEAEHAFAGTMSIIAVALVTWMVFWMRRAAREMRGEMHGKLDKALLSGGFALGVVALVAVLREGLETALFLWASTSASAGTAAALGGALLGIATAVGIGWAVYRGAVRRIQKTIHVTRPTAMIDMTPAKPCSASSDSEDEVRVRIPPNARERPIAIPVPAQTEPRRARLPDFTT